MGWFKNLKIARKLQLAFLAVLVLMAVLGIFSISQLAKVKNASSEISRDWMPAQKKLGDIKLYFVRLRGTESQLAIYDGDVEAMNGLVTRSQAILTGLDKTMKDYAATLDTPQEREIYPKVAAQIAEFLAEHKKIVAAFLAKDNAQGRDLFLGYSNKLYPQILADLEKLIKINQEGGDAATAGADDTFSQSRVGVLGLLIAALAIGMGLAITMGRIIAAPLQDAVGIARRVAGGDLGAEISVHSKDETGQLLQALQTMNEGLRQVVGQVRNGTDSIATASTEIATGNLDLSRRTEQQATALEELTSTVKQNTDNARQANQLAMAASGVAARGGGVVGEVVQTMEAINDASNRIVEIISVIDGIAFQTNILALNAAVEAARAGEQGRGFAVVASEVRSLAQRSASAAKEIKQLIDDSVSKVGAGTTLVRQAGSTMSEVVESVKRVTDVVSEISAASTEQSVGIDEINRAVSQMDEVTQQNAALVEQAAAAAQSMQEQAAGLANTVSVFKLR